MKKKHINSLIICSVGLLAPHAGAQSWNPEVVEAAVEYIQAQPTPVFKEGHQFPALVVGREMPVEVMQVLADDWGYSLSIRPGPGRYQELNDPDSTVARTLALVKQDPERYKLDLRLFTARGFGSGGQFDFVNRYPELLNYPDAFLRDDEGNLVEGKYYFSPLAPDAAVQLVADHWAQKVRVISDQVPVYMLRNAGESGFRRSQHTPRDVYLQDPAMRKAWEEDGRAWVEFMSDHKYRHEKILRDTISQAAPEAIYIVYSEVAGGHYMRGRREDWEDWDFSYRPGISDYASSRHYNRHSNTGLTGDNDMFSHLLLCRAEEIQGGADQGYFFLFGGNSRRGALADITTYEGFLNAMYVTGAVGGIAGWFWSDPLADKEIIQESIPQFLALGRVHARFSHLDDFLFNSHLLTGPDSHRWWPDYPAYEFPTGHRHKRVVARRHNDRPEWLIAAWAADGIPETLQVDIPELGLVEIEALPSSTLLMIRLEDGERIIEQINP